MEVIRGLGGRNATGRAAPRVATIGFFDGVHRGHQAVIGRAVEAAAATGVPSAVVTFDRHPREVLTPESVPALLTSLERKAELVEGLGVDALLVLAFTREFSTWPPDEFARRVLSAGLGAVRVVVGANFTFGHRAAGTIETLEELGPAYGFVAEEVSLVGRGRPLSSSAIRQALLAGETAWPRRALGRPFRLDGTVVRGAGRGRGLGFPTANLAVAPGLLVPGPGVYAGRAVLANDSRPAAISVGTNPTFGDEGVRVEAHLLDFDGDLVGRGIGLEFWERLRDQVAFDSVRELVDQIAADVARTLHLVGA